MGKKRQIPRDGPAVRASPKRLAEKLAAEMGVDLQAGGGNLFEVTAEAPPGTIFAATGTHGVVAQVEANRPAADAWRAILSDLRGGLIACGDPGCEICNE